MNIDQLHMVYQNCKFHDLIMDLLIRKCEPVSQVSVDMTVKACIYVLYLCTRIKHVYIVYFQE